MESLYEINYLDIEENIVYEEIIEKVIKKCYEIEDMLNSSLYINIILTTPKNIKEFNKKYRNIDKETDVLSFPMFEKNEIKNSRNNIDILGDVIISIDRVIEQAKMYENTFEREFAYMVVHSFYHLLGYDHVNDEDKKIMREKEENVLNSLNIKRSIV